MKCQLSNISVHYEVFGEGRPVVMISGIPSGHQILASWMEPIFASRPGWQRVYFDNPGTGLTPANGIISIDQVLEVVIEFIDKILPDQKFTLVGLSAGGYLARGYVHLHPQRVNGLCLIVPWLSEHEKNPLPPSQILSPNPAVMQTLSPKEAEIISGLSVIQNQKVVDWYRNTVLAAREHGEGLPLEQFTFSFDLDHAAPFSKPTLLLTGRQDSHVGYHDAMDILEQYPRATLAVLDRAGHALGIEQESLLHALVHEWLDRMEAG